MGPQRFILWTGGRPDDVTEDVRRANALPVLPAPAPLQRALAITYRWGETQFEMLASACSIRRTPWGDDEMAWLNCKAMQTALVKPGEPIGLMNVLVPAHYVTALQPGPTFQIAKSHTSGDVGVFPPNKPTPADHLPLDEIEKVIAASLAVERN